MAAPSTILCRFGYGIPRERFTAAVRAAVTVQAENVIMKRKLGFNPNPKVALFSESATRVYVPRKVGIDMFGPPERQAWKPAPEPLEWVPRFVGRLRHHQMEFGKAHKAAGGWGVVCLPCAGGKTAGALAIACDVLAEDPRPVLIIVNEEDLGEQWAERIEQFVPDARVGWIQGDRCEVAGKHFVIAMLQSLARRDYPGAGDVWSLIVVDECHTIGSAVYTQCLLRMGAPRMLGLSATPRRGDGLTSVMHMFLGPLVYKVEPGLDPGVDVEQLVYESDDAAYARIPEGRFGVDTATQLSQIASWVPRNEAVWARVLEILEERPDRQILLLSDRREVHLDWFKTRAAAAGISFGEHVGRAGTKKATHRAAILRARECRIVFGTYHKAKQGLDIPSLNCLVMLTSHADVEQATGRVIRVLPEDRTIRPLIVDVVDARHPNLARQAAARRRYYKLRGYTLT